MEKQIEEVKVEISKEEQIRSTSINSLFLDTT